ncbi:MAG TPA: hypothetical protein VJP86_05570 [Vicinamibacterales bacterium]|nr:hypothetical protein [Vicinamibacterales bacterium]
MRESFIEGQLDGKALKKGKVLERCANLRSTSGPEELFIGER